MRKFLYLILTALSFFACTDELEPVVKDGAGSFKDGYIDIEFGNRSFDNITITTRSTVPTIAEDAIINIYVLVFDNSGKRVYGRFFNHLNRKSSADYLDKADCWYVDNRDFANGGVSTSGTVRLKAPIGFENGRIYIIANIDPAILNLSYGKLDLIGSEADLQNMSLNFNQESTSRSGNLLMVGKSVISIGNGSDTASVTPEPVSLERIDSKIEVNVEIVPGAKTSKYRRNEDGSFKLDDSGEKILDSEQEIESFTPTSWKVVNLPKDSWLVSKDMADKRAVAATKSGGHFDSTARLFETVTPKSQTIDGVNIKYDSHGFSFYMLESFNSMKKSVGTEYHLRDRRVKDAEGYYSTDENGGIWEYAPETAPYLVIEGEVQMKVDDQNYESGKSQTLNALATYYIHLGDFKTSLDNYDIKRGHHYKYTVKIKGVNSIEVEVVLDNSSAGWKESNEMQSGATGEVFIAQEEIHTFDSHYGQRVFRFNFDAILTTLGIRVEKGIIYDYEGALETIADELTWYVSSPFGREGTPDRVTGNVEVPNGLDYKWVYFLKNDLDSKGFYDQRNQWFPGAQHKGNVIDKDIPKNPTAKGKELMDVSMLCNYLRRQIAKKAMGQTSDFDPNGNIYFTAFVDEYYYDVDPISGEFRNTLWHEFVNKPMRMMHILCSAEMSRDGESSATGSVVTIRQRSIQTVYATDNDLCLEGWGVETVDETVEYDPTKTRDNHLWFFNSNEHRGNTDSYNFSATGESSINNYSKYNGLYNSGYLWKLIHGGTSSLLKEDSEYRDSTDSRRVSWDSYLNYKRPNDFHNGGQDNNVRINFLLGASSYDEETAHPDIMTMRYSCTMRNRDNNGNNIIDQEEVRWYLASTEQLMTLYIGDLGLAGVAQLYHVEDTNPNTVNDDAGDGNKSFSNYEYYPWRSHVVSSTRNGNSVEMVWAEEGCSTSSYGMEYGKPGMLSLRCVRNLGVDQSWTDVEARKKYGFNIEDPTSYPLPPIEVDLSGPQSSADTKYTFNLSNLNSDSKRIKVIEELIPMDENSEQARTYSAFETGPLANDGKALGGHGLYPSIRDQLSLGYSYCPDGYRMPNVREAAIMYNYIDSKAAFWGEDDAGFYVNTYYSFGGPGNPDSGAISWIYSKNIVSLGNGSKSNFFIRCVRDVEPTN